MQAVRSLQFATDEPDRRRYVIESAPGHPGLLALVLPWAGAPTTPSCMAGARFFAPLIAITRDGGEGRTPTDPGGPGPDRLPARRRRAGDAPARARVDGPSRCAAGGAPRSSRSAMPLRRHAVDGGAGDEGRRFAAFEAPRARWTSAPTAGRSPRPTRWAPSGWAPIRRPTRPTRAAGSVPMRAGDSSPGLYVADGSTFPTGIGVNPMLTIMAMARRVSRTRARGGAAGLTGRRAGCRVRGWPRSRPGSARRPRRAGPGGDDDRDRER